MSVTADTYDRRRSISLSALRVQIRGRLGGVSAEAVWLWLAVVVFWMVSVWWLTQDDRVPDFDSGVHMLYAIVAHSEVSTGHISAPFTDYNTYPPLVHLLGALTSFLVGIHPMAMILASNLVFVPLLAFGCYGTGKLVAGPRAGLLAGVFALGTPMFVSMMHEYDLDPPQAAMVAVTVWAILASRRFERLGMSALGGVLFGLALLTKETSVVFIAGLLAVVLIRGGWRNWPGLIAFVFAVENIAGPWYIYHATQLTGTFTTIGGLVPNSFQAPPRFSTANAGWYFWNLINVQTLAVFAALFFVGCGIAAWRWFRHPIAAENLYPELLAGALFSYLAMTYLTHKDPRYTLPALVYVAVLGTSWIVTLRRPAARRILSAAVVGLAAIYFIGMSFGIGGYVQIALPGSQNTAIYQRRLTLYEAAGWVKGGPETDGHIFSLLHGLRRAGIVGLILDTGPNELDFNSNGITSLAAAAGIYTTTTPSAGQNVAFMFVHNPHRGDPRPCQTLNDGTGIYVAQGNFAGLDPTTLRNPAKPSQPYVLMCPGRAPLLYHPGS